MTSIKDDRGYNQGFAPSESARVRMERRADWIVAEMGAVQGASILEIGCGTGELAHHIAQKTSFQVLGTDVCAPFIKEATERFQLPNVRYEVVDFNDPDSLPGQKFDYIVGNGILHHLYHNLDTVFASMQRLLKSGGEIIFLEPNIRNPYIYFIFSYATFREMANLEPDEMAFSRTFITERLVGAGFDTVRVDYKDFLLPGVPASLIRPSIVAGAVLERLPAARTLAQSLFIRARKPG